MNESTLHFASNEDKLKLNFDPIKFSLTNYHLKSIEGTDEDKESSGSVISRREGGTGWSLMPYMDTELGQAEGHQVGGIEGAPESMYLGARVPQSCPK